MFGLTPIDKKIVASLEKGKAPPEIAIELHMNPSTVYYHLYAIRERYKKAKKGDETAMAFVAFVAEIDGIKKRSPSVGYYLRGLK